MPDASSTVDLQQQLSALKTPQAPQLAPIPTYTPQKTLPPALAEPQKAMAGPMMLLATLAGAFTANPIATGLKNAAAMNDGIIKGNDYIAHKYLTEFNANLDSALNANQNAVNQYKLDLQQYQNDASKLQNVLVSTAIQHGDDAVKALLEAGQTKDAVQLIAAREKAEASLREHQDMLNLRLQLAGLAPGGGPGKAGGQPSPNSDLHGDALLITLDPQTANIVKGMVQGTIMPPTSYILARSPQWSKYLQLASQYDPSFDESTWSARVKTRGSFSAGPDSQNVTAINTALAHAGRLQQSLAALGNYSFAPANAIANAVLTASGSARPTVAREDIDAFTSEMRKVFAGNYGGLTELESWRKDFPINGSPAAQQGALREGIELLSGRMDALADKYNRAMGTHLTGEDLLSPPARKIYDQLTASAASSENGAPAATNGNVINYDAQGNRVK